MGAWWASSYCLQAGKGEVGCSVYLRAFALEEDIVQGTLPPLAPRGGDSAAPRTPTTPPPPLGASDQQLVAKGVTLRRPRAPKAPDAP